MGFSCSAPCKAILFGEHYVVYGAPAISIPIEPRNEVVFSNSCQKGICLKSSLGEAQIISKNEYHGPESLRAFSEVAA
ncbi:MAG: hypothetical protein QW275_00580, partial [Candidatus Anstonellaceae archaeon]